MKRTGPTNPHLQALIIALKTQSIVEKAPIWKRIAIDLERPTRQRRAVNLSRISRYAQENEVIIVPGKVLGSGVVEKKITLAAFDFSDGAKEKLLEQKCTLVEIADLMKKYPKGQGVRILG